MDLRKDNIDLVKVATTGVKIGTAVVGLFKKFKKKGKTYDYTPPAGYTLAGQEGETVSLSAPSDVAYGCNGKFSFVKGVTGSVTFAPATFGDPIFGYKKAGYVKPVDAEIQAESVISSETGAATNGVTPAGQPGEVSSSGSMVKKYLPYIIGAAALILVVILIKKK